ncbi:TerD family protein [Streptodolium elevatio]|uniref:TerD family protein n=1 Tax=Streptodolium elevatio TaxID=3157996 RepID=A0ABV3DST1_9ACTN
MTAGFPAELSLGEGTRMQLSKGANAPVPTQPCKVTVGARDAPIDVSAVLLGRDGKVRSDEDLVFYNHPRHDGVAVAGRTVQIDLPSLPADVERIAVVASIDPDTPAEHFDAVTTPGAVLESGAVRVTFAAPAFVDRETVAVVMEVYRRAGAWKVRAVGQGWASGLAGLATDFGVDVDDPELPAEPAVVRETAPTVAAPIAGSPALVSPLGPVLLSKGGQATISLHKENPAAVITAVLEWDGGSDARRSAGADLDLYALYVPRSMVTPRGTRPQTPDLAVYYRDGGSLTAAPFIALDGDSTVPGRETITIARPNQQGYVLICAYSAVENGTGSFKSYGARAVVSDGHGSSVTAPLFNNRNLSYWVAIALIDFTVRGGVDIRHVERYSGSHVEARPMLYTNGNFLMSAGKVEFKTR